MEVTVKRMIQKRKNCIEDMISTTSTFVVLQCLMLAPTVVFAYYTASAYYGDMEYAHFSGGQDTCPFLNAIFSCSMWRPGSELAQPRTEDINNAVTESTAPYYEQSWIGATDLHGEGYWRWIDNDLVSWENWGESEPNDINGEDCALTNNAGTGVWNDFNCCSQSIGFVCEIATTRVQPLDHSTLTFHEVISPITFAEAQTSCKNIRARLVKIENDKAKRIMMNKIERTRTKYWVDNEEVGCSTLNEEKSEERSCDDLANGYVCETVRPHNVQVSDETPVINEAGNLVIECSVSGFPLPDVAWYKNDQLVENQSIGEASATLKITNAKESDEGLYICRAYNGSTKSSGLSRVTVATKED